MQYPEYQYVGYKRGLVNLTGIVGINAIPSVVEGDAEVYRSIYRFPADVLGNGSLANLRPDQKFFADDLAFDLDSLELENAYADAIRLSQFLDNNRVFHRVYFSGRKGFHLLIPTHLFGFEPASDEGILKRMASHLAVGLGSFDPSIYNKTRVFRVENTINEKSGLYKIRVPDIAHTELGEILDRAKEPQEYPEKTIGYGPNAFLTSLYQSCLQRTNRLIQGAEPNEHHRKGILAPANEGKRNQALYSLAREYARRGIIQNDAIEMCCWWNQNKCIPPLPFAEIERTVFSAYKKGVNEIQEDSPANYLYAPTRALQELRSLYKEQKRNVVYTGYDFIDKFTMGLFRGEVVYLIARPGNFKTAILSGLMRGIAKNCGKPCLYFSMDIGRDQLTVRHIQAAEGLTQDDVLSGVTSDREFPKFEKEFANVHVIDMSALSTDVVLKMIDRFIEEHGEIGAIGFDYLSLFKDCANDTGRTAKMATEIRSRIAKAGNCPVICLVQARRIYEGREGDCEIDKTAGKDSSAIEDTADYVIGVWKHWDGDFSSLWGRFLKARKFLSREFPDLPYFRVGMEKDKMRLEDIVFKRHPPRFKQKDGGGEE